MTTAKEIILSLKNKVRLININRPSKRNAINNEMYKTITNILNEDANNKEITASILTGSGNFYSSGNDFTKAMQSERPEIPEETQDNILTVKKFVDALINYPKLMIAVVNGPAIGIAVTTLCLCDIVYASDKAWFETPFVKLALCPEGCSSYTFPKLLGRSKASEMLLIGKRMSVEEACRFGLVSEVITHENMKSFIEKLCDLYSELSAEAITVSKQLMNNKLIQQLRETNELECKELEKRFKTMEYYLAVKDLKNKPKK